MKHMKNKYLKIFLKNHTVEDVVQKVSGELNEFSCKEFTAFFGNKELIISPSNETEDEQIYFADRIGFFYQLVRG